MMIPVDKSAKYTRSKGSTQAEHPFLVAESEKTGAI